jgi:beta-lactamase class A
MRGLLYASIALSLLGIVTAPALLRARSMVKAALASSYQTPQAVAQATAEVSASTGDDEVLNQAIEAWVLQRAGQKWGVAIHDLKGKQVAGYNTTTTFDSASIYKLYLLYPLLEKVPLEKFATTKLLVNGQPKTLHECVDLMLRVSDNPCAESIGYYIGWSRVDSSLQKAGFRSTHLNMETGQPVTTPADTASYMTALYEGKLIDQASMEYIFSILGAQKFRQGIPAACNECVVMNKTGELPGILHDTAVVKVGDKPYVISIFSQNGRFSDIADLTKTILSTKH